MFNSNRFTSIVTQDTQDRLLKAQSNDRPIAQGESHPGAVAAIQGALAALNAAYLSSAEADGFFGPRTARAVEAFQRDYGLVADAIVGQQTLNQLDALFSPPVVRVPRGVSVHVGVDKVDPAHYGSEMALGSCKNDANAMRELADELGYDSTVYLDENATTANFIACLRSAASNLFCGDSLLISFSGHGGQVPNTSYDDESDLNDETLCFFDRMLIDDELSALLAEFREGVRVHIVFDSCHSGTAFKDVFGIIPAVLESQIKGEYQKSIGTKVLQVPPYTGMTTKTPTDPEVLMKSPVPIKLAKLVDALEGEKPDIQEIKPNAEASKAIAELFGLLYGRTTFGKDKFIGIAKSLQVYDQNSQVYDAVKSVVGSKDSIAKACTTVILSACDDSQTTPAGDPLSLFTFNLFQVWNSGHFNGSYSQLHRAVVGRARPDATPQINVDGNAGADSRLLERPFTF